MRILQSLCLALPPINKGSIPESYLSHMGTAVVFAVSLPGTQKGGGVSLTFPVYQDNEGWIKVNIVIGMRTRVALISTFTDLE